MKLYTKLLLTIAFIFQIASTGCPLGFDKFFAAPKPLQSKNKQQQKQQIQKNISCEGNQIVSDGGICIENDVVPLPNSQVLNDMLTLSWGYPDKTNTTIDFMVDLKQQSWVGIGFGTSMYDVDMIIGQVSAQLQGTVGDYYSTAEEQPSHMDGQSAVTLLGFNITEDNTIIKYNRVMKPLTLNQDQPFTQLEVGATQPIIFAYGDGQGSDNLAYHGYDNKGQTEVVLTYKQSACVQPRVMISGHCQMNDIQPLKNTTTVPNSEVVLQWEFVDSNSIDFIIQVGVKSWVGLGFGPSMTDTDMVIANIGDDNIVTIFEAHSIKEERPLTYGDQYQTALTLLGYKVGDDNILVKFNRLTHPTFPNAAIIEQGQTYNWITAYSNPGQNLMVYHETNHRDFSITLDSGFLPIKCQTGFVLIAGECVKNDISDLDSSIIIDQGYELQWQMINNTDSAMYKVTLDFKSWVGIGFNATGMIGADMVIADIGSDNVVTIYEGVDNQQGPPPRNSDQSDLSLIGYKVTDNLTIVKFVRQNKPRQKGYAQISYGDKLSMIAAHSDPTDPKNTIEYHGPSFFKYEIELVDNYQPTHLICPEGQTIIDGICKINDINGLSSNLTMNDLFHLQYSITDDNKYMDMLLNLTEQSYLGIGFGTEMKGGDIIIANIVPNNYGDDQAQKYKNRKSNQQDYVVTIYEGIGTGHSPIQPNADMSANIELLGYVIEKDLTIVKIRRIMDPSSIGSTGVKLVPEAKQAMMAAYSKSNSLTIDYHDKNKINFQATLKNGMNKNDVGPQLTATFMDVHKIFFLIAWGILIDISLILVQNCKAWTYYGLIHGLLQMVIDFGTIILFIMTLYYNQSSLSIPSKGIEGCHYINGMIFVGLILLNHTFGIIIKYLYIEPESKNRDSYLIIKKIHKYNGLAIYFSGKLQVIAGVIWAEMIVVGSVLVAVSIVLSTIALGLHKSKPKFYLNWFRIKPTSLRAKHHKLFELIKKRTPKAEVLKQYPETKYLIANDQVVVFDTLSHPGGNYITSQVKGRDVDCFLFGGYSLETTKIKAYTHSPLAEIWLSNHSIGSLYEQNIDFIVTRMEGQQSINIGSSVKQGLLDTAVDGNFSEITYSSQIQNVHQYSNTISRFDFNLDCHGYKSQVKNHCRGVKWLGRHFTVKASDQEKKRCYTTIMSLQEDNAKMRNIIFLESESDFRNNINYDSYKTVSDTIPFVIKRYDEGPTLSGVIHENENDKNFEISGPHGLGLNINDNSQGNYILVSGGTGILPFMDLLDFLLHKVLYKVALNSKGKQYADTNLDPFDIGYGKYLENFKLKVFAAFNSQDDFAGSEIIEKLAYLEQKHKLGIVEIVLKLKVKNQCPGIQYTNQRFDEFFFEKYLSSQEQYSRVWVCGPPVLQKSVPQALQNYVDESQIDFV